MKKIIVIKDASLLREGIIGVLETRLSQCHIKTVSGAEWERGTKRDRVADLVIIDLDTRANIYHMIDEYRQSQTQLIVWASSIDNEDLLKTFKMKLNGYLFNGMEADELIYAINKVLGGDCYIHPELSPVLLNDYVRMNTITKTRPVGVLSRREWEVLELIAQGCSNDQISHELYITDKTVKNHVSSILKKLNVSDRLNAVLFAMKERWIVI